MNNILRKFVTVSKPSLPLRAELVICQVLATGHLRPCTAADLCAGFSFSEAEVLQDTTLAMFVSIMRIALTLVDAPRHMEFLVQHVVVPLSEDGSGKRYVTGSGSESVGTQMRYAVFEQLTGMYRPKSVRACQRAMMTQKNAVKTSNKRMRADAATDADVPLPRPNPCKAPPAVTLSVISADATTSVTVASLPCEDCTADDEDGGDLLDSDLLRQNFREFDGTFTGSYNNTVQVFLPESDVYVDWVDWVDWVAQGMSAESGESAAGCVA
jgi:hypothetical protein